MSEYQYYEFLAIDRPLTEREMGDLRDISTRAHITPTSFVNHYEWGDLISAVDRRPYARPICAPILVDPGRTAG